MSMAWEGRTSNDLPSQRLPLEPGAFHLHRPRCKPQSPPGRPSRAAKQDTPRVAALAARLVLACGFLEVDPAVLVPLAPPAARPSTCRNLGQAPRNARNARGGFLYGAAAFQDHPPRWRRHRRQRGGEARESTRRPRCRLPRVRGHSGTAPERATSVAATVARVRSAPWPASTKSQPNPPPGSETSTLSGPASVQGSYS
jgi:hypothetical protein